MGVDGGLALSLWIAYIGMSSSYLPMAVDLFTAQREAFLSRYNWLRMVISSELTARATWLAPQEA